MAERRKDKNLLNKLYEALKSRPNTVLDNEFLESFKLAAMVVTR